MLFLKGLALAVDFQINVAVLVFSIVAHRDVLSDLATQLLNKLDVGVDALVERSFRPLFVLDKTIVHRFDRLKRVFDGAVLPLLSPQVGYLLS